MLFLNYILAIPVLMMGVYNILGAFSVIPFSSKKLNSMKDGYGDKYGTFLYTISYGVSPTGLAVFIFILTLKGIYFFSFF